jgi:hypothetical protein
MNVDNDKQVWNNMELGGPTQACLVHSWDTGILFQYPFYMIRYWEIVGQKNRTQQRAETEIRDPEWD